MLSASKPSDNIGEEAITDAPPRTRGLSDLSERIPLVLAIGKACWHQHTQQGGRLPLRPREIGG